MIIDLVIDWSTIEIINPLAIVFLLTMLICVGHSIVSGLVKIVEILKPE